MFFTTSITIHAFTLYVFAFTNTEYFLSSQKIMQEKYVKSTLTKVNSWELTIDLLKKVLTTELERTNRYKLENRIVQKKGIIIIGKA